ncbi:hypothetical protein ACO0QE_000250 [Hanseniaspora vineae]
MLSLRNTLNKLLIVLSLSVLIQSSPISNIQALFGFNGNKDANLVSIEGDRPINGDSPLLLCDVEEPQLIRIDSIDISPNPPQRGTTLEITAEGVVLEEITEGSFVDVEVRLGYIKLLSQTYDLCEELEKNDIDGLKCPVAPGLYKIKKTVDIPQEVPAGKYNVVARAYTENVDELTCVTGDVIFSA